MRNASGVFGLVAMLVLAGGGGLGCGGDSRPEPEHGSPAPVDEREDVLPPEDAEEAPEVSAAWNTPSTSCTGLVPTAPGTGRFVNRNRESSACLPGTSDGKGNLALGIFSTLFDAALWTAFTPEGLPRDTFNGGVGNLLMPQKSGFHLASMAFGSHAVRLQTLSRTGAPLTSRVLVEQNLLRATRWNAAEDPRGGSVVAWVRFGAVPGPWQVVVQRFHSSGEPRTPPLTVREGTGELPAVFDVGADTQGRVLVLWEEASGGGLRGRWLRRDATFTSEFPVLATPVGPSSPGIGQQGKLLSPLIGGGFALEQGEEWVAVIRSKKTTVEPAPGWLVVRPGTELVIIRGGRGYALLSPGTFGSGGGRVEVLAPAGNSCGDVPLPDPGTLHGVQVGRDGTVIAEVPESEDNVCTYRYWPRLLH